MNLSLVLLALLTADVHSGTVAVPRLGSVSLPSGSWKLNRIQSDKPQHDGVDVFVFEKVGKRLERITFQVFPRTRELTIGSYVDSIGDSMVLGVPTQFADPPNPHDTVHCQDYDWVKIGRQYIAASFIYSGEKADPWMSHALVRKIDGRVWICIHASPHVISPTTVFDLSFESKLTIFNVVNIGVGHSTGCANPAYCDGVHLACSATNETHA